MRGASSFALTLRTIRKTFSHASQILSLSPSPPDPCCAQAQTYPAKPMRLIDPLRARRQHRDLSRLVANKLHW